MIRRDCEKEIYLICQHDHAQLAGKLVFHVGNNAFAPPSPLASIALGVAEHDCGWRELDEQPVLNAKGLPSHVFEINHAIALAAWSDSVARVAQLDPYAGLLVSLHAMSLAVHAAVHLPNQTNDSSRHDHFKIQQFLHRQIELQESLRKKLQMRVDLPLRGGLAETGRSDEEDLLQANFHLLQLLDQISLVLCFDRLVFDRVDKVIPRPRAQPITVRMERLETGVLGLRPWPFDLEKIELRIPARRLPAGPYRSPEELMAAFVAAKPQALDLRLQSL
jgi:hypothetical protein